MNNSNDNSDLTKALELHVCWGLWVCEVENCRKIKSTFTIAGRFMQIAGNPVDYASI